MDLLERYNFSRIYLLAFISPFLIIFAIGKWNNLHSFFNFYYYYYYRRSSSKSLPPISISSSSSISTVSKSLFSSDCDIETGSTD